MKIPNTAAYFPEDSIRKINENISTVLRSGYLSNGKFTRKFEAEWSRRLAGRTCLGTCNGTSALELAFRLAKVEGKRVVVPASTIYLDAFAAERAGGKVIFADVDPENGCMRIKDLTEIEKSSIRSVCATHLGGIVTPEIEAIRKLCDERGWFLVEDAAHSHSSTLNGKPAGTFGHASIFSFFATKVVTCGEGGLITFEDRSLLEEANMISNQGLKNDRNEIAGGNMRMSEFSACVGLEQTRIMNSLIRKRTQLARVYDEILGSHNQLKIVKPDNVIPNFYKYTILLPKDVDRDELKNSLTSKYGIPMPGGIYYTPCHLQPVWKGKYKKGDFPGAEKWSQRHLCLPILPQMNQKQVKYIANKLLTELDLL